MNIIAASSGAKRRKSLWMAALPAPIGWHLRHKGLSVLQMPAGSGVLQENAALSITEQIAKGKAQTAGKWKNPAYIAYFQAFTNTYAPVEKLRQKYEEALACPEIEGISIATRADCLPADVLSLLAELNKKTNLWVELGLQTADAQSAAFIRRGYPLSVFTQAVYALAERNIPVVVHIILGLPGESRETVLRTIDYLNRLPIQGVKLQLLHVLSDSDLADLYRAGEYTPLEKEEYLTLVGDCIAHLRADIVLHRLTGTAIKTPFSPLSGASENGMSSIICTAISGKTISDRECPAK